MAMSTAAHTRILKSDTNQSLGIAQYAIDFMGNKTGDIDQTVYEKIKLFHTDSVVCGISALALKTNAPTVLRNEALTYAVKDGGACVFGSKERVAVEKAIVANCSAVREWDSNGTVFGYSEHLPSQQAGEFGHNDFYPVVIAAAQMTGKLTGKDTLRAMICLDEIRGRLASAFSLKTYKIDHVVYGAIASAAVYGAIMGATAEQIESAIGMCVAHYIPFRAIRAGKQLSDSKGASAAISTEVAILSVKRSMNGFMGPRDIFRNPESVFCWNEPQTDYRSPFDIYLCTQGKEFAVCGMHFKLGVYEHQSAGALQGLIMLLCEHEEIYKNPQRIKTINITAYEPAYGIIGKEEKKTPTTRQSADHSMVYIVSSMLRKAIELGAVPKSTTEGWCQLMLTPYDYSKTALFDGRTRELMSKITFKHGGPDYDSKYPDGIPTSIDIYMEGNSQPYSSGMIMYPGGHCRNTCVNLEKVLQHKFDIMTSIAMDNTVASSFVQQLQNIDTLSPAQLNDVYTFPALLQHSPID